MYTYIHMYISINLQSPFRVVLSCRSITWLSTCRTLLRTASGGDSEAEHRELHRTRPAHSAETGANSDGRPWRLSMVAER